MEHSGAKTKAVESASEKSGTVKTEAKTQAEKPAVKSEKVEKAVKEKISAKTVKTEKKPEKKPETKRRTRAQVPTELANILLKPLVTEKTATQTSEGKYSFVVASQATRVQVQKAVKAMFGVQPTSVNIQRIRGEWVQFGRHLGRRKAWKKAIVTLPKGEKIDVYEGV